MFLSLRNVEKRFGAIAALDAISLDIAQGEFVCFLGPSGCGKTTLLRVIAGLERADGGTITLDGVDLSTIPTRLRNFGLVFQSYSLFPNMTIARNVAYGLECRGWAKDLIDARVDEMLRLVHLADQAAKYPHQLSGGQQQRIALARALAPRPVVLLLDEPLSALDAKVREDLRGEIKDLQSALSITTIMVTHDQHEAMEVADRIVVMNAGRVAQIGSGADLYERPENRFVGEFIGRMNRVAASLVGEPASAPGTFVGVRPEHVELVTDAATATGTTDVHCAIVEKSIFLGSCTRLVLRVGHDRVLLEVRGKCADLVPGSPVRVRIPSAVVHRLHEGIG